MVTNKQACRRKRSVISTRVSIIYLQDHDFTMEDDLTSLNFKPSKRQCPLTMQQYDNKLTQAFQSDCETLLQKFNEKQDLSFTAFSQLWKEMCFLAIFKGQDNLIGMQIFQENCFFIVKKFIYLSDVYVQTGALYLLYGLYYKQPIKDWVKIRLTQSDFNKLKEIIDLHKSTNTLDPVFIFSKLRLDGAFQYCAIPQSLGIEVGHLKRLDLGMDASSDKVSSRLGKDSVLNKFKKLMEEEPDLVQFEETDEEYKKLSQKYKKQVFVFQGDVGVHFKRAYSEVYDVPLDDKPSDEQNQLKTVKNKALMNVNATYRGERKVVTAVDLDRPSTSK